MSRHRSLRAAATAATELTADQAAAVCVAGRYQLLEQLAEGGHGRIYAATDVTTGREVVVKYLDSHGSVEAVRMQREALAMRRLRIPGVVKLLDEGRDQGRHFLVLERVHGLPFPGRPVPAAWHEIAAVSLSLFRILQAVHEHEIIHRDLKPGNVLVSSDEQPHLLDFGLARGSALASTVTRTGRMVGTLQYIAPEQLDGERVDRRADLYAIGVMLYQALSGRLPHDPHHVQRFIRERVSEAPTPLRELVPDLPVAVATVVDGLLARDPGDRPASAGELIEQLQRASPSGSPAELPRLGDDRELQLVTEAVQHRRGVDVGGPPGSGRTRLLRDAEMDLTDRGWRVHWLPEGERPFDSLRDMLLDRDLQVGELVALQDAIEARLRERFDAGTVLFADDAEELDRWSQSVLDRMRNEAPVIRAWGPSARTEHRLEPLSEDALRALFAGPDRLLHRREDGARILYERTGGMPRRIVEEVGSWLVQGIARWVDDRLILDAPSVEPEAWPRVTTLPSSSVSADPALSGPLEELLGWIALARPRASPELLARATSLAEWEVRFELEELVRLGAVRCDPDGYYEPLVDVGFTSRWTVEERRAAYARLTELLPVGEAGRLDHAIGAASPADIVEESGWRAQRHRFSGRLPTARALLKRGLSTLRRLETRSDEEDPLLAELTKTSLDEERTPAMRDTLGELDRSESQSELVDRIRTLLAALLDVHDGDPEPARRRAEALGPFDDEDLETWRWGALWLAAQRQGLEETERILASLEPVARESGGLAWGRYQGWLGVLRYQQARFTEAAHLHEASLPYRPLVSSRLSGLYNAAIAWLDAEALDRAEARGQETLAEARARRHPFYELAGEYVMRSLLYRRRVWSSPDRELVEAAGIVTRSPHAGAVALREAAHAWRARDREAAGELARCAVERLQQTQWWPALLLAEGLELVVSGEAPIPQCNKLVERAESHPMPLITLEVYGLVGLASSSHPAAWRRRARGLAADAPRPDPERILALLSVREILDALE